MKPITTLLLLSCVLWGSFLTAQITLEPGVDGTITELTPSGVAITTQDAKPGLRDKNLVTTSQYIFFLANDSLTSGEELWVTDGTVAGTQLVLDINPGTDGSDPKHLCAIGDTIYFSADDGVNGAELWMSDGTASGTKMVKDIFIGGNNASNPEMMVPFKGGVLFRAKDNISASDNDKSYLWWSDGTEAGTNLLHPIQPVIVPNGEGLTQIQVTGNGEKAFFVGQDDTTGQELWVTWGDSTKLVLDIGFEPDTSSAVPNATVDTDIRWLFTANEEQIWFRPYTPAYWTNDSAIMGQFDYLHNETWVSNGEPWGTYPIGDLNPVPDNNDPKISGNTGAAFPFNFNGRTYYRANDGVTNTEMHSTDLTIGNFPLLKNICGQAPNGNDCNCWIETPAIFDGFMYFKGVVNGVDTAVTGLARVGQELLRYDPVTDSVEVVADIYPGETTNSFPRELTVANGRMYFRANDAPGQSNYELYGLKPMSEDSTSTPFKVVELDGNALPGSIANWNEKLVFVAVNLQRIFIYDDEQAPNPYDPGSLADGPPVTDIENPQIPQPWATSIDVPLYLQDYVKIYPNPADQFFQIEVKNTPSVAAGLYDSNGRLVWKGTFQNGKNQLPVSHLPDGVYAIFTSVEGYFIPQKVIIRH